MTLESVLSKRGLKTCIAGIKEQQIAQKRVCRASIYQQQRGANIPVSPKHNTAHTPIRVIMPIFSDVLLDVYSARMPARYPTDSKRDLFKKLDLYLILPGESLSFAQINRLLHPLKNLLNLEISLFASVKKVHNDDCEEGELQHGLHTLAPEAKLLNRHTMCQMSDIDVH